MKVALPLVKTAFYPFPVSNHRFSLLVAFSGLSGFSAVTLGALGAHALHATLTERQALGSWQTAATYHLIHSVAALALLLWAQQETVTRARLMRRISAFWLVGCLLFSGSIYGLALGGPRFLGPVTPLGGLALLAGWTGVVWLAFKQSPKPDSGV
jgi:uncharacterized membrane protein YgdD (TMEM256/DUF423 family)